MNADDPEAYWRELLGILSCQVWASRPEPSTLLVEIDREEYVSV